MGRAPHRYVFLAYSDQTGQTVDSVYNRRGLSTVECFNFLLRSSPYARLCGYYLGYDWTKILEDLPNACIYYLLRPELRALPKDEGGGFSPVRWRGFRLHYLAGSMVIWGRGHRVRVWDLGRFFQGPFIDAISAWECGTEKERSLIRKMKEKRSGFEREPLERIKSYCFLECRLLAELATKLEKAHVDVGLKPRVWHGPGSTAGEALRQLGIAKKLGEIPHEVNALARYAYFGGRFEQSVQGRIEGPIYGYDIASAYPFQLYRLPCLEHGKWERTTSKRRMRRARHALCRYELTDIGAEERWGPLPVRTPKGAILFPRGGSKGWVWRDELLTANEHWNGVKFCEAWCLESDCDCHPFERMREWYRERVRLGKDGRGRVLKLAYNSCYGKIAQQVGNSPFASMVWAGMITSGTRSQLLELVVRHRNRADVLALATDGLYSQSEPNLPPAPLAPDTLGSWERKEYGPVLFVRPGVYWGGDVVRARGIGRKTFGKHYRRAQKAIARGAAECELGSVDVFHGALSSVYRKPSGEFRRMPLYGQWAERPVKVSLAPQPKRTDNYALWMLNGLESSPYRPGSAPPEIAAHLLRSWAQPH